MTDEEMVALTEGLERKSDRMRVLNKHDVPRADIARFLGVRYQQVRNTLEGDKRTGYDPVATHGHEGPDNGPDADSAYALVSVAADGSISLGAELLKLIPGTSDEAVYVIKMENGLLVTSMEGAARSLVRLSP